MAERVFLILDGQTAAILENVVISAIDRIADTECNNKALFPQMVVERAHLSIVAGQLKAPT